jgi:hypothetical protein
MLKDQIAAWVTGASMHRPSDRASDAATQSDAALARISDLKGAALKTARNAISQIPSPDDALVTVNRLDELQPR